MAKLIRQYTLGKGKYGKVILYKNKLGQAFAVKSQPCTRQVKSEIECLKLCSHPYIVGHVNSIYSPQCNRIVLCMTYCQGQELFYLVNHLTNKIPLNIVKMIARQMLSAIDYMHNQCGIVHRDIKPENIIWNDREKKATLIDFGFARLHKKGEQMISMVGTPYYIAYEIANGKPYYTKLVDEWSFGVILFIMCYGYPPFYGDKDTDILKKVCKGTITIRETRALTRL